MCKAARAGSGYPAGHGAYAAGAARAKKETAMPATHRRSRSEGTTIYTQIVSCFLCFVNFFDTKDVVNLAEVSGKAIPEHFSAYVVIPSNIYFDRDIKPRAKMLYGLISCMSNERGYAFPRNETLQRYLGGVSEDTVSRTLKELVNAGAIVVEDGDGGSPKNIRKIYLANLYPDSLRKNAEATPRKNAEAPQYKNNKRKNNTTKASEEALDRKSVV